MSVGEPVYFVSACIGFGIGTRVACQALAALYSILAAMVRAV